MSLQRLLNWDVERTSIDIIIFIKILHGQSTSLKFVQDPKQGGNWQIRIVQKLFTHKWLLVQQAAPITGVYHKVNRKSDEMVLRMMVVHQRRNSASVLQGKRKVVLVSELCISRFGFFLPIPQQRWQIRLNKVWPTKKIVMTSAV